MKTRILVMVLAAGVAACGKIVDDWGPPAGYGAVVGRVSRAAGGPAVNLPIVVGRCEPALGSKFHHGVTGADGRYRVRAELPEVGLFSGRADTIRQRCAAFVMFDTTAHAWVDVHFARAPDAVRPDTLNFVIP